MKHTNWDSCSVSSSRPASSSAGLQEYNCMNIKQGSAGIRAWTSAEKTLIHADSELIPTWGTSVHVCDTADIMPPVPYSLDMLTCSWEHLSSDSVWSYVTCTSGACIRPRPSRVYRTHSRGALQCRPMISLHYTVCDFTCSALEARAGYLSSGGPICSRCSARQFSSSSIIPPWLHSLRLHPTWWCSTQISSSSDAVMVVNLPVETIPRYTVQLDSLYALCSARCRLAPHAWLKSTIRRTYWSTSEQVHFTCKLQNARTCRTHISGEKSTCNKVHANIWNTVVSCLKCVVDKNRAANDKTETDWDAFLFFESNCSVFSERFPQMALTCRSASISFT